MPWRNVKCQNANYNNFRCRENMGELHREFDVDQKFVFNHSPGYQSAHSTHHPATIGRLLLAENFQKPKSRASNSQVVNARLPSASVHQIDAGETLERNSKQERLDLDCVS